MSTSGRPRAASARQKNSDENRADAATKTQKNKDKAQEAAARKKKRTSNNAQAAVLRETGNVQGPSESPEDQIAALTAQLKASEAKNDALKRKNKKLVRRQGHSNETNSEVTPIPKPKGKFTLQDAMGLSDNRALFTELQAGIHALALEAKIDFGSSWSQQEPGTVAKILRVAEERHQYLRATRFPRHWATSSILQRYINSVRAYNSGKTNPSSGVSRRRQRVTKVGRLEIEANRRQRISRRTIYSPPPDAEDEQMDVDTGNDNELPVDDQGSRAGSPSGAVPPRDDSEEEEDPPMAGGEISSRDDDNSSAEEEDELPTAED